MKRNFFVRAAIRACKKLGAVMIPGGVARPYQFAHAKNYWQNVPRGHGGTVDTKRLLDVRDPVLLEEFNGELEKAREESKERQTGFAKALESVSCISSPKVLDYGSGWGFYGFEILDRKEGAHVVFADINENNLRAIDRIAASKGYANRTSAVLIQHENAEDFNAPHPFDLILAMGVLHHTPYARQIVRHLLPFLNGEGIFQAMLYNDRFLKAAARGRGRRLNTSRFGKITDPDAGGFSNPYSEAYTMDKVTRLFEGLEFLSLDEPTPYYSIYRFQKPR